MSRTLPDRIRHAVLFEAFALAIFTPGAALVFNHPIERMGVIGIVSATIATVWNFLFNLGFDRALIRFTGGVRKTVGVRVVHALMFEGGLVILLIPMVAWFLGISLWAALMMDLAIVAFYLVYAFLFNLTYDRVFPVPTASAFEAAPRAA